MKLAVLLLLPSLACAHMISMSTGEARLQDNVLRYELRMPAYEATHAKDPETALLSHIHFRGGGVQGRLTDHSCATQGETFLCKATYEFPGTADPLEIECKFYEVTVPNHIHLLRVYEGDKSDQAVFDLTYNTAEIRFRPPSAFEVFVRESSAGLLRAVGGLAPLLFLLSLALAARSLREMGGLTLAFLVGEIVACVLAPQLPLALSPRFIEAAAALTIAYLAFEVILLPDSGSRWLVVGILGLFHGAYFSRFLTTTGYHIPNFLLGVVCGELLILTVAWVGLQRTLRARFARGVPVLATVLLTVGVVWFIVRVWT